MAAPTHFPEWAGRPACWLLVGCLTLAVLASSPAPPSTAQEPGPVGVSVGDPIPAPGSVVAPGPQLIAARIRGAEPRRVRFLIDGRQALGPLTDPDGGLSARRGVVAPLRTGQRRLGVEVDGQVVEEWTIEVGGLAVERADPDPLGIALRTSGRRATPRPVVLVNPDHPQLALAAIPLAVALDALLLPVQRLSVPAATEAAMADARIGDDHQVLLVGGPGSIGEVVATVLRGRGYQPVRLDGATPEQVSRAAAQYLAALGGGGPVAAGGTVFAPTGSLRAVADAAVAAASLGAVLILVGPDGLEPADTVSVRAASAALVATTLTEEQRAAVLRALGEATAVSDDALAPRRAAEAMVVADPSRHDLIAMAARGAAENRAVLAGIDEAAEWVAEHRPDRVVLIGEPDDGAAAARLQRAWVDGPEAPRVEALVDPGEDGRAPAVRLASDAPVDTAAVHVDVVGFEWPGRTEVDGHVVTWRAGPRPRLPESLEPPTEDTPARLDVTAAVTVDGATRHLRLAGQAVIDPLTSISRDGWRVAGGLSRVAGTGPLRTFSVEVEPETGLDLAAVTDEVEQVLLDPRGWTADGSRSLQRVGNSRAADIRVVVARPGTVDLYCGRVGLRTGGRVSCWDGFRALLNLDRWNLGVPPFHADVTVYRQYLVNHEVGHGLGYGHEYCTVPGTLAPVMMQQTGGIGACLANGWPYPFFGTRPATG